MHKHKALTRYRRLWVLFDCSDLVIASIVLRIEWPHGNPGIT